MNKIELAVSFHEHAPTSRNIRVAKQFVRQDQKKQISTTITDEALELRSAVEPVLERSRLAQYASITAMTDCVEIMGIVFGEKRIASPQGGVVNAKMFFENFTPARERAKTFARRRGFAIVPAQIGSRLFAFEDRSHGRFAEARSIGCDIGAIAALGQTDFSRAGRISIRLGPEKREPLQP